MSRDDVQPKLLPGSLRNHLKSKSRSRRQEMNRLGQASVKRSGMRNDPLPALRLVHMPIDDLRMPARAVRKLDPAHIDEVAGSISALGFCVPVLIGKDNLVLDGGARIQAARLLGLGDAPCLRIDHLTDDEQRLLRLAVNRLGEKGQWNLDELKIEFEELILAGAPIEITGFELQEIDQIVLDGEGVEQGPLAPTPGAIAVAHPGDAFQLGAHRVVCGSATDPETFRRLMDGGELSPAYPDRRALQCENIGPRDRWRASRVRDGLGRNVRRRVPRV